MNKQDKLQEIINKTLMRYVTLKENAKKHDEEFEDTLSRKYSEGYLDGLLMAKNILATKKKEAI